MSLINSARLGESAEIRSEVVAISSAAGSTTLGYSMHNASQITFIVGMGTAAATTTINPTLTVIQSGDAGLATSTTITGATGTIGSSTANAVNNAQSAIITFTTATTLAETITFNGYTLTEVGESTLVSTIATALAFGSSVGATNAGGLDALANSLSSVINASTLSAFITATTISTAAVRITLNNTASTDINVATTGTNIAPAYEKACFVIDVKADDLNSTSQYVGLQISSAATAVRFSVSVVKTGLRYAPTQTLGYSKTPTS